MTLAEKAAQLHTSSAPAIPRLAASVTLQAGKTIRYVTLPDVSSAAVQGSPAMHIFAIATG